MARVVNFVWAGGTCRGKSSGCVHLRTIPVDGCERERHCSGWNLDCFDINFALILAVVEKFVTFSAYCIDVRNGCKRRVHGLQKGENLINKIMEYD